MGRRRARVGIGNPGLISFVSRTADNSIKREIPINLV